MQVSKEKTPTPSCTECQRRKQKVCPENHRTLRIPAFVANQVISARGNGPAITARLEKCLICANLDKKRVSRYPLLKILGRLKN
jgi:hypothetical protein